MEEGQSEVDERGRGGTAVDLYVPLGEVPAPGSHHQRGGFVVESVVLATLVEGEIAAVGVAEVQVPLDDVVPGRAGGILAVGHEDAGTRVEGVDHHLAGCGTRYLDPAVEQVLGHRVDGPGAGADLGGLWQEAGPGADVEVVLALPAGTEEIDALVAEGADQVGDEPCRLGGEQFGPAGVLGDLDVFLMLHAVPMWLRDWRQLSTEFGSRQGTEGLKLRQR